MRTMPIHRVFLGVVSLGTASVVGETPAGSPVFVVFNGVASVCVWGTNVACLSLTPTGCVFSLTSPGLNGKNRHARKKTRWEIVPFPPKTTLTWKRAVGTCPALQECNMITCMLHDIYITLVPCFSLQSQNTEKTERQRERERLPVMTRVLAGLLVLAALCRVSLSSCDGELPHTLELDFS